MESYQKELTRVKEVLKANPKGMTITDISKKINVNRNSVAKYLDILQISGHAEMRSFGPAKVYFISQRVPISTMLNLSTDYIVVLDRDLKIVHTNDNFLNFTNVEREVLLGKGIEEFPLPIFTSGEIISKIKEALDGRDSTREINFPMGEREFYFRIKLIPTTFDDGRQGVTILLEDITERKKAEEELRLSEAKFRGLFENVFSGVYQTTPDGKIISANPAVVQMLGYDSEADLRAIDIAYELYADPEERKILTRKLEKKGELRNVELVLRRKDGDCITVLENARAVHDGRGEVLYYEGTLTDITERKKTEMQLKSLFEASRLINSTVDITKIFKFISDSVQQLVGFDNLILFLVSEDKRSVYPTYASEGIRKKVENLILNYGEGLVGHCIENKEILLLNNAHDDKRGKKILGLTEVFVSQIVVPLIIEDKCVGALHISKVIPNAYDQKDVDVLKPLSEVISSALRNFWLYNQLRGLGVELEEKIV
ncbi:MAG: PAS domain S-box protein [Methanomicrobia archaeon]|nr:PAS domain S-box protein [Methanomicrobia archaeon]